MNLPPFLDANTDELRADLALICDTDMWDRRRRRSPPACAASAARRSSIHAADRDLHSGFYGSAAANPNHVLARIIADLHDADGRVTIPGFYDGVPELPAALRESWDKLDFDGGQFLGEVGLSVPAGEKGRSRAGDGLVAADLRGQRHGRRLPGRRLQDGDPVQASAKISFRLVFDQDPHKVREAFRASSRRACRPTARSSSTSTARARAVAFDTGGAVFQRTRGALTDEWGRDAAFVGGGGSIPVTTLIKDKLGIDVVMVGFGLNDDRIHSPTRSTT